MNAGNSQTILIVDDSLMICRQIEKVLACKELLTVQAHTGKEALEMLELHGPDLILLDVVLPDIEGYELCKLIKERDQNNAAIVFLTSKDSDSDVVRGFSLGACDYIKKPFSQEELKLRVKSHLQLKKQQDELNRMNNELRCNMEKLNYMAFRDGLTGLYNRHYVVDDLMEEIRCHDRVDTQNVLIMADVDDFKKVNDQYGHEAGDVALVCISNLMEGICKRHRVIRWGGEEFLIVLFAVTKEEAEEISEQIRSQVEAFPIVHQDKQFNCTITLGLYAYRNDRDMDTNIERADQALYKGKRSGKNRSEWYEETEMGMNP